MQWQDVCTHKSLQNLPFKIELNEYGNITMSPVKVAHSAFQSELSFLLRSQLQDGRALTECAISTSKGTKVADVAWASSTVFKQIQPETECSIAPEICIEVISSSNSTKEMNEKQALYFESGAKEFWLCDKHGKLSFFNKKGHLKKSELAPMFPTKITL
ncbi:MAG: Uma2 family endonuclease [Methylococcaceae bacterium]|nr:Uma2 family endonuclease [Methylococcaceae bacterium]